MVTCAWSSELHNLALAAWEIMARKHMRDQNTPRQCGALTAEAYLELALASPTTSQSRVSTMAERYMSAACHSAPTGRSSLSSRLCLTSLSALAVSCKHVIWCQDKGFKAWKQHVAVSADASVRPGLSA